MVVAHKQVKQESIPVGCIAPTSVATIRCQHWGCYFQGVYLQGVDLLGVDIPGEGYT